MKIRTIAAGAGLCLSLMTAGCAASVAGQAEIAPGAVLAATSTSAPAPFPEPSNTGSSSTESSSTDDTGAESSSSESSTADSSTADDTGMESSSADDTGAESSSTEPEDTYAPESSSTGTDDSSVGPTSIPNIPGLSKDCSAVLAGITAFSKVLQGAGTSAISQATVDEALGQLPASGLPSQPQADITVLRTTVAAAAGKTFAEVSGTLTDGKVLTALQDLSDWAEENCG